VSKLHVHRIAAALSLRSPTLTPMLTPNNRTILHITTMTTSHCQQYSKFTSRLQTTASRIHTNTHSPVLHGARALHVHTDAAALSLRSPMLTPDIQSNIHNHHHNHITASTHAPVLHGAPALHVHQDAAAPNIRTPTLTPNNRITIPTIPISTSHVGNSTSMLQITASRTRT
jgi:hypothetical protein